MGVRSPAPPLKVGPDRSAQFRSPLIYNFIPLRRNRSTLAQIENYSACLRPAVFNRSLTPPTHCLRGRRGAGLLRDCCGKNPLHFYSVVEPQLRRGWTTPDTRVFRRQCGSSNLLTWVRKGKSTRCKHAPRRVRHAAYML